ncbi:MAG: class II glutamine amidotransferase [Gammaproteobacteria bacterium]|nr:MAG: class II glutamine amidotransferase [Gammaproteobacteria bacterium]
MCELLGLNANVPTDICFSFSGLMQRGGRTGPHRDGWGMSLYEGRGARSFHDPRPSVASEIADFIRRHSIRSRVIISHIRKANRGRVCLENTHPFTRELWGRCWTFAHNGQLKGVKRRPLTHYRPIGTTDSEYAFCWMLDRLREGFARYPARTRLWRAVAELAADLEGLGVFNFLMSDSHHLYAWCSTRLCWLTRRHPFGPAHSIDTGEWEDFSELTTPDDVVTIIASRPLTDNETWNDMARGSLEVFHEGEPCLRAPVTPLPPTLA